MIYKKNNKVLKYFYHKERPGGKKKKERPGGKKERPPGRTSP